MDNLIVQTGEEARKAIEYFLCDLAAGLYAAKQRGVTCRMPEYVDLQITFVKELDIADDETESVSPETTETQTTVQPEVVSVSVKAENDSTTQENNGNQTQTYATGGADRSRTTHTYEG